tara:strand:- start:39 stop:266 length:228 start_codon:yes stop_codon:yes gene_type:complete
MARQLKPGKIKIMELDTTNNAKTSNFEIVSSRIKAEKYTPNGGTSNVPIEANEVGRRCTNKYQTDWQKIIGIKAE